ncbi:MULTISPECIES: hypothetical protein [Legionella]|uniref:Uncharacterized protein n=1 Tax=Legionella donaldsonii TaxID=45060 RepID=A0A378J4L0_9GAMM|nr:MULTISPECIES: hypothetical protein [Legionella]MCC5015833.1 hypothetical protein [Legionella sp. 31fI33]STX42555.1 Uncharacterised protein [Legionella donaldsonii]
MNYKVELEKEHNKYKVLSQKRNELINDFCSLDHTIEELSQLRQAHKELVIAISEVLHKSSELIQKAFYATTHITENHYSDEKI